MRAKYLSTTVIVLFLLTCISKEARSQDGVPGPDLNSINTQEPNAYDERPLLYESEGRNTKPVTTDTIQTRTPLVVPAKRAPTPADLRKPKDEDPLNFNFLFYIITKFKSSDLMEE